MDKSRWGGGTLATVGVTAPRIADMMGLTVSAPVGWALLGLCAVAFIVGIVLVLWPAKRNAPRNDEPGNPGSAGFYFENCSGNIIEGNTVEGYDAPIVGVGGRNNQHRRNIVRKGKRSGD